MNLYIEIMRAFVRQRQMLDSYAELRKKIAALEQKYDNNFKMIFDVIHELMQPPEPKRRPIGFRVFPKKKQGDK
jgi:hypothetical protein